VPTKTTSTAAYVAVPPITPFDSASFVYQASAIATAKTKIEVVSKLVNLVACKFIMSIGATSAKLPKRATRRRELNLFDTSCFAALSALRYASTLRRRDHFPGGGGRTSALEVVAGLLMTSIMFSSTCSSMGKPFSRSITRELRTEQLNSFFTIWYLFKVQMAIIAIYKPCSTEPARSYYY
jgi:hypothetical protein